jgi:S1-C subfamily serine protease
MTFPHDPPADPLEPVVQADPDPLEPPARPQLAPEPAPARPSRGLGTVLAAAVLSAVLASVGTAFAVGRLVPDAPGPVRALPTAIAAATGTTVEAVDLTEVVADARESVVTITTNGASTGGFLPFGHPTQGVGSGIILTADGYILTNRHVIDGARTLTVALHTGELVSARLVRASATNDLALVKVTRWARPRSPSAVRWAPTPRRSPGASCRVLAARSPSPTT